MERRFIIAALLAFLVLYGWQALFVRPVPRPTPGAAVERGTASTATPAPPPGAARAAAAEAVAPTRAAAIVGEAVERDIRFALKENFRELVSSRQWTNSFGHHCLEVVVRGVAEEVPIEWHYYLVAPESGSRVSLAVTIQGEMVSRFAAADRQLVNALELVPATSSPQTAARDGAHR